MNYTELIAFKQGNILVDKYEHASLADFGLSNFSDSTYASVAISARPGAYRYMAPEIHFPDLIGKTTVHHTQESDIYSFGSLFWEVRKAINFAYKIALHQSLFNHLRIDIHWCGSFLEHDSESSNARHFARRAACKTRRFDTSEHPRCYMACYRAMLVNEARVKANGHSIAVKG